jgi:hypothetical protein
MLERVPNEGFEFENVRNDGGDGSAVRESSSRFAKSS